MKVKYHVTYPNCSAGTAKTVTVKQKEGRWTTEKYKMKVIDHDMYPQFQVQKYTMKHDDNCDWKLDTGEKTIELDPCEFEVLRTFFTHYNNHPSSKYEAMKMEEL